MIRKYVLLTILLMTACSSIAFAQNQPPDSPVSSNPNLPLDDAWWTGPMLAPSAAVLPRGHFLAEPYLYDVIYPGLNGVGSLAYLLYGLTDKLSIGAIPTAGLNLVSKGLSSSGVGAGDLTIQAQYGLTRFHFGNWMPTTSVALLEKFPTGKYDHLGDRPSDGLGNGAYNTTIAFYSQTYFRLRNHRLLRLRVNVSQSLPNNVKVEDVSVYRTDTGFRGHASIGGSSFLDASWEYSVTRRWVVALDATYRHDRKTGVIGCDVLDRTPTQNPSAIQFNSGSRDSLGLAPAIEYSWNATIGLLLGTRVIPASDGTRATITPTVALNVVH